MLSILVDEQTQGELRSAVRSQFDHLNQLHWIADIHPSGIILSSGDVLVIPVGDWNTPPSKSLAWLCLAGQLVVILLLRWSYFQEYHTEYFKISYDKG